MANKNIEVICIGQAVLDCITKGWDGGSLHSIAGMADSAYTFEPDTTLLRGTKVVSLASLFRIPFVCPETILAICQTAKFNGTIVTADTKLGFRNQ